MANVAQQGVNYNTPAPANDFERGIAEKHSYSSYASHFKEVYMGATLFGWVIMALSAIFSSKFLEARVFAFAGDLAQPMALIASGVGSYLIVRWTDKLLVYWDAQGTVEPVLGTLLFALIVGNIYADLQGAPEWSYTYLGQAPADTRTSELKSTFSPQIEAIAAEIKATKEEAEKKVEDIETKHFYYCGKHKAAHRCPSTPPAYIHPTEDAEAVAEIAQIKSDATAKVKDLEAQKAELTKTMTQSLSDANVQHTTAVATYSERLSANQSTMRGISAACTILFLILSKWLHKYGKKQLQEMLDREKAGQPQTQQDKEIEQWAKENRSLREELAAMRERMEEQMQAAQQAQATPTVPQTPVVPLNTPTPPTPTVQATSNDPKPQPLPQQPKAVGRFRKAWAALMGN